MGRIFKLDLINATTYGGEEVTSKSFLEIPLEHDEELDEFLDRFGTSGFSFMFHLNEVSSSLGFPWAVVAFPKEYQVSGHILAARKDREGVKFGSFSSSTDHSGSPAVAFLVFANKGLAESHSKLSPLFEACWGVVNGLSENGHWFCIADELPSEWVRDTEKEDSQLFLKFRGL